MTRTRRLYRVTITHASGYTTTRHYQTRRYAEYLRSEALKGFLRDKGTEGTEDAYRIEPARSVVVEASDPITWPDGDPPGGAS